MQKDDSIGSLRSVYPVVGSLPPLLRDEVERLSSRVEVRAGNRLFGTGDPAAVFPFVVSGRVRVARMGREGAEVLLYRLGPGEACALTVATLLGDDRYPAAGVAEGRVVLFALPRAAFLRLVLECEAFRAFVFRGLSRRLAHLMTVVDDVAFRGIRQRLASHLLERESPLRTTHQLLAHDLGTRREIVSRTLQVFRQAGCIRAERGSIELLDRRRLEAYTDDDGPARSSVCKVTDSERTSP